MVQMGIISGLTLAIALLVGLNLVAAGDLSVGALSSYFATATILMAQVERSSMLLSMYLGAKVSMDRHRQVMVGGAGEQVGLTLDSDESEIDTKSAHLGGVSIEFDQVHFSYGEFERPVLTGFSLGVRPGEIIALVGSTGSGKSTVLQLAADLYSPTSGSLRIDGQDAGQMPIPQLRSRVAFAFEEPVLFSASMRQNVLLGARPDLTEEEQDRLLERALDISAADFVAQLPQGLETVIGEEGMSLSGGQRQRLSLARAIAADPGVLLLDDPLSALDVSTEERVITNFKNQLDGTTVLLTAHRPSTVALADRVVLLQEGRVAALGTHSELLSRTDYRALVGGPEHHRAGSRAVRPSIEIQEDKVNLSKEEARQVPGNQPSLNWLPASMM